MFRATICLCALAAACTSPVPLEHCTEAAQAAAAVTSTVTWHRDVRPIIESRCVRCHQPLNIGPFPLRTYDEVFSVRESVRVAVKNRSMPPWLPARCCNTFRDDVSLSDQQIATIDAWVEQGAPEGDPGAPGPALPAIGGLSRVDLTLRVPEPYTPTPAPGRVDDFRCFWIDWPLDRPVYVTGLNPIPGARPILHHLVVAVASGDDAEGYESLHSPDGKPGYPCEGGFGDLQITRIIGGSLIGGDYAEGVGARVDPGSKVVLSVHYSLPGGIATLTDQTALELKVDELDTPIEDTKVIVMANPAWLVSDAFRIPAGEKNVSYAFQFDPRGLTSDDPVLLRGFTPHMHYLGSGIMAAIVRGDGKKDCLIDIPRWDFGWEQPYWFAQPIRLDVGDELIIKCTYDNTREHQPAVNGVHPEPRDVAWGTDNQDMCAGFLSFSPEKE